jgi:hypothetical protein
MLVLNSPFLAQRHLNQRLKKLPLQLRCLSMSPPKGIVSQERVAGTKTRCPELEKLIRWFGLCELHKLSAKGLAFQALGWDFLGIRVVIQSTQHLKPTWGSRDGCSNSKNAPITCHYDLPLLYSANDTMTEPRNPFYRY